MRTVTPNLLALLGFVCMQATAQEVHRVPDVTVRGHSDAITDVAFSPDATLVATAALDSTVRIARSSDGSLVNVIACGGPVVSVTFTTKGDAVITATSDEVAREWDVASGAMVREFRGHTSRLRHVAVHLVRARLGALGEDGAFIVWNLNDGSIHKKMKTANNGDTRLVSAAAFDFVTGTIGEVGHWSEHSSGGEGALRHAYVLPYQDSVEAVAHVFAIDINAPRREHERIAAVAGGRLYVFNRSDTMIRTPPASQRAVSFHPSGWYLASAGDDGILRLWDADNGIELAQFTSGGDAITSIDYSPDGTRIVTATRGGRSDIWSVDPPFRLITSGTGYSTDSVRAAWGGSRPWDTVMIEQSIGVLGDWDTVAIVTNAKRHVWSWGRSTDATARVRATQISGGPETMRTLFGARRWTASVAWLPGEQRVAVMSSDRSGRVYDVSTGRILWTFADSVATGSGAFFFTDGRRVALTDLKSVAMIWDLVNDSLLATLTGHSAAVWDFAVTRDGSRIITAGLDSTLRFWDTTGVLLATVHETDKVFHVALSSDNSRLIKQVGYMLVLRDATNGARIDSVSGTGQSMFTADDQRIVNLTGRSILTLTAVTLDTIDLIQFESSDGAQDLQFLPGDSTAWVAGGSGIRSVHLSTGEVSRNFITGGTVYDLDLDSAKQRLVSAHDDGTARIWNLAADLEPRRDTAKLATVASASDEGVPARGERRLLSVTSLHDVITVDMKLDVAQPHRLYVVDIRGHIVRAHEGTPTASGRHRLTFDVASLPAGSYYVVLNCGGAQEQRAVVIL